MAHAAGEGAGEMLNWVKQSQFFRVLAVVDWLEGQLVRQASGTIWGFIYNVTPLSERIVFMEKLEKLIRKQAAHLKHLQKRIDILQASVDSLAKIVCTMASNVPQLSATEDVRRGVFDLYLKAYVSERDREETVLSEYPFEEPPED